MQFKCEINMDNAAFENFPASELARILRRIANDVEKDGITENKARDINGNTVGKWQVQE